MDHQFRSISRYHGSKERELFRKRFLEVKDSTFVGPGESPLKECADIKVKNTTFSARYAGWLDTDITFEGCHLTRLCRAPLWYTKKLKMIDCKMTSPKALRECQNVEIKHCDFNGIETFWQVDNFAIDDLIFKSYYPFLECHHGKIKNLKMNGKYSFQHCFDIEIEDSQLDTKDAFWHSHDIVVKNCLVKGEYVAWFSKDLTFINCTFSGTQPFVSSHDLKFINCTFLEDADLAFEDSTASGSLIHLPKSFYNPKNISFTYEEGDADSVTTDKPSCHYDLKKAS